MPLPAAGRSEFGLGAGSILSMRWSALHDAAEVVCGLAGLGAETRRPDVRNFPAIVRDLGGWRYDEARQGVDDLAAMMEPGLAALLAVHARGISAAPAALALWHEFLAARAALLDLVPAQALKRLA
jgi:hypothetical protein